METTKKSLFALQMASQAPQTQPAERVGMYDPTEQVWKDEGTVLACTCHNSCFTDCGMFGYTCIFGFCIF